jgi:hypothetical protein
MTDRDRLPVKATTGNVVASTEQSGGSLVKRGLDALRNRQGPVLPPYGEGAEVQFEFAEHIMKVTNWLMGFISKEREKKRT